MVVLKSRSSIANPLEVKDNEPVNPVVGEKWLDGKIMKTWNGVDVVEEDLTGPPGDPGKPGTPGVDGKPTGVIESVTAPPSIQRYEGMLWKNITTGITNIWRSGKWEIYTLKAENITTETLAAISGIMGTLSAGYISGSTIVSNFNDVDIGGLGQHVLKRVKASGTATMANGKFRIEFAVTDDAGVPEYKNSYGYVEAGVTGFHARWAKSNGQNLAVVQLGLNAHLTSFSTGADGNYIGGTLFPSDLWKVPETQLVAADGFSAYANSGGDRPTAKRDGKNIQLSGAFKNDSQLAAKSSWIIGYLPEWARPGSPINFRSQGSGMNTYLLVIRPNGEMQMSRYGSADYAAAAAGSWLNISYQFGTGD